MAGQRAEREWNVKQDGARVIIEPSPFMFIFPRGRLTVVDINPAPVCMSLPGITVRGDSDKGLDKASTLAERLAERLGESWLSTLITSRLLPPPLRRHRQEGETVAS
jgi:hypothetical protein